MITIEEFNELPRGIFLKGVGMIKHPYFGGNVTIYTANKNTGLATMKWVASKGSGNDWAIFHSIDANIEKAPMLDGDSHMKASWEMVLRGGAKIHDMAVVKHLVQAEEEVYKQYRH